MSSLHFLFPPRAEAERLQAHGMMLRHGVQFHWSNAGYATFDDFLAALNHEKRKKIRQDRRKVSEAGHHLRVARGPRYRGAGLGVLQPLLPPDLPRAPFHARISTLDFFVRIGRVMPQNLLLVLALRAGKPDRRRRSSCAMAPASAAGTGARWSSTPPCISSACYYQAIEYCIARGLATLRGRRAAASTRWRAA